MRITSPRILSAAPRNIRSSARKSRHPFVITKEVAGIECFQQARFSEQLRMARLCLREFVHALPAQTCHLVKTSQHYVCF